MQSFRYDKLITGPRWRAISKDRHNLDMNVFYQGLYDNFILWGSDASGFMSGFMTLFGDDIRSTKIVYLNILFCLEMKNISS